MWGSVVSVMGVGRVSSTTRHLPRLSRSIYPHGEDRVVEHPAAERQRVFAAVGDRLPATGNWNAKIVRGQKRRLPKSLLSRQRG